MIIPEIYNYGYREAVEKLEDRPSGLIVKTNYLNILCQHEFKGYRLFKTGIESIDNFFNGGIAPGLYILGAEPGMGKTSFCLQLADMLSQVGHQVAYFSLEMTTDELLKKSFSRMSYNSSNSDNLPISKNAYQFHEIGNLIREKTEDIKNIVKFYSEHIYPNLNIIATRDMKEEFTIDDIKITLNNYQVTYNKQPVVIIDYLQLLKVAQDSESDGIRLDTSVIISKLKGFSRKYQIPIIVISALNRASYSKKNKNDDDEISLDCFKETGNIEYSADCLLVMTGRQSYEDEDTYDIKLHIKKNRYGKKDTYLPFKFIPKYSCFSDEKDEEI